MVSNRISPLIVLFGKQAAQPLNSWTKNNTITNFSCCCEQPFILSLFRSATMTKYIIVSGGVVSGIGKGVIGTVFCKSAS